MGYPTAENIQKIGAFDDLVKTEANGDLSYLPELKAWKMWYKEDMAGRLTETGREDHIHLAQRMVETFPTLLTKENRSQMVSFGILSTNQWRKKHLKDPKGKEINK